MGGAPLPEAVQKKYLDLGIRPAEAYGMSETVAIVVQTIPRLIKPGSIGFPFSDVDIRIVDPEDNDKDMPIGEEGELWIHDNSDSLPKTGTGKILRKELRAEEAAKREAAGK